MKRWREMSEEERKERLDELSSSWPSMYNDHPRQVNSPEYGTMRELSLEYFVKGIDMSIYQSFIIYKKQYEKRKRDEYLVKMEYFLESYSEQQPEAADFIKSILKKMKFFELDEVERIIRDVLNIFPPKNWPIRRGEENE
jgi:hypothetical protein